METSAGRLQRIKEGSDMSLKDREWLIERAEKAEQYEQKLCEIANIDAMFMKADGTENPFDENEALAVIDRIAQPVWKDFCEQARKENKEAF